MSDMTFSIALEHLRDCYMALQEFDFDLSNLEGAELDAARRLIRMCDNVTQDFKEVNNE